jgi:nucleolar protein 4
MPDGKPRAASQDGTSSAIVVRNLPDSTTSSELSEFFAALAPVQHAFVVNKKTDEGVRCEGYGFVTFATKPDAATVVARQSIPWKNGGSAVTVAYAKPRKRRYSDTEGVESQSTTKKRVQPSKDPNIPSLRPRLIFRNLSWKVRNPGQLERLVRAVGIPKEIRIPRAKQGKMTGFAFVEMKTRKAAAKVIEAMNGKKIEGRPVAVDWCVSKDEWNEHHTGKTDKDEDEGDEMTVKTEDEDDGLLEESSDSAQEEGDLEQIDQDSEQEIEGDLPSPTSQTIFIRNIPYLVTRLTLFNLFRPLGHISSLYLVTDPVTSLSRGTAFLTFSRPDPANTLLTLSTSLANGTAPPEQIERYTLEGRTLQFLPAVSHVEADRLKSDHAAKKHEDRRNLYLLKEGQIDSRDPLCEALSSMDLALRRDSLKMRKDQLAANPALHLSLTRLAVRNIPRSLTEKEFRELAIKAVKEFDDEVAKELREGLTDEEKARDILPATRSKKVIIQAKVVEEKTGRSKGYGFLEYNCHENALKALRWLNARAVGERKVDEEVGDRKRRLLVEFAIENAQVVRRRRERQEASRRKAAAVKEDVKAKREAGRGGVEKRKRGIDGEEHDAKVVESRNKKKKKEGGGEDLEKPAAADIGRIIGKKRFLRKVQRAKQGK